MQIDHVHFYVEDARKWRDWFVQTMGFEAIAWGSNSHTHTEVVGSGSKKVKFALSSPLTSSSPVARFLRQHPPGVADLAFTVKNLGSVLAQAKPCGAMLQPIQQRQLPQGQLQWSQISGKGDLKHTLIERTGNTPILPQEWVVQKLKPRREDNFIKIDHVVLNVAAGELEETVSWYEAALGFKKQQTFKIQTEKSALYSQVIVHPEGGVQFPINEPMSANSQIQEFLDLNQGAGIQHIALNTVQITELTKQLRSAGLEFLQIPANYYTQLQEKYTQLNLSPEEWQAIVAQEILVDDHEVKQNFSGETQPLLLQIFTQPIFSQPTFFFELIERRFHAKGFGEGNFRALFEAIEREQLKRGSLPTNSSK